MKMLRFLFLTIFLSLCFFACERTVPADQYFCKAEEVFVLETPFDEASAIIVMYKGDDLFLLGDTVYLELAAVEGGKDSMTIDSSQYYVKVKAKRGVIGWVNASELQHERPKAPPAKPATPVKIAPIPKPKVDPLASLDSLLKQSDSLKTILLGNYQWEGDSSNLHQFQLLAIDSSNWTFQWKIAGVCDTLINGQAQLKARTLYWSGADSCQWRFEWRSEKEIKLGMDSSCLETICLPKGSFVKTKTIKAQQELTPKSDSTSQTPQ